MKLPCDRPLSNLGLALLLAGVLLIPGLPFCRPVQAAVSPSSADEYVLKAAFLYNLAKFLDWPAEKFSGEDSPVVLGCVGEEAFERFSAVLKGKKLGARKVVVRLVSSDADVKDCHVVFVTRSQRQRVAGIVETASKASVLSVGETDQFLDMGGMIRFYEESDNLRLEISPEALHRAELTIKGNALSTLINKGIVKLRKAQS